jgi:hypothetical protein
VRPTLCGTKKIDALADLLRDRNPAVNIVTHDEDLMQVPDLDDRVRSASVVVLATDNEPTRYRLNEACVRTGTPLSWAVFLRAVSGARCLLVDVVPFMCGRAPARTIPRLVTRSERCGVRSLPARTFSKQGAEFPLGCLALGWCDTARPEFYSPRLCGDQPHLPRDEGKYEPECAADRRWSWAMLLGLAWAYHLGCTFRERQISWVDRNGDRYS